LGLAVGQRFSEVIRSRMRQDLVLREQLLPFASTAEAQPLLAALQSANRERYPRYWDELVGTADGSGVPLLHVRTATHAVAIDGGLCLSAAGVPAADCVVVWSLASVGPSRSSWSTSGRRSCRSSRRTRRREAIAPGKRRRRRPTATAPTSSLSATPRRSPRTTRTGTLRCSATRTSCGPRCRTARPSPPTPTPASSRAAPSGSTPTAW